MVVVLGQQYTIGDIGEKAPVILYTNINAMQVLQHPEAKVHAEKECYIMFGFRFKNWRIEVDCRMY